MAKVQQSSGNVFHQLGFSPEKAAHLEIRAALMSQLRHEIEKQGLTQAAAARLLRVSQPRVSDLVRGKIDLFSIDSLVTMLAYVGVRVSVRLHPTSRVA